MTVQDELLRSLRGITPWKSTSKGGEIDAETPELASRSIRRFLDASVLGRRKTPSARLRRRLAPVARDYYEPGRRLFNHEAAGAIYPQWRIAGYHATVIMTDLMEFSLELSQHRNDPLLSKLSLYLERHLMEERHADEPGGVDLDDLAVLGFDPDEVRNSPRPAPLIDLVEDLEFLMGNKHPVAILGFLQLEQYHGRPEMVEAFIQRTGLPREAFSNVELHAQLEPGHAAEIDRQMDTLPLKPWHEELIYMAAADTLRALTAVFTEVIDNG